MIAPSVRFYSCSNCRLCGSSRIHDFLHFAELPVSGIYFDSIPETKEKGVPLTAGICESCGLVQLRTVVSPIDLYTNGVCGSTNSSEYRSYLSELSAFLLDSYSLQSVNILEIGSADGSLLAALRSHGAGPVWGFEPSRLYQDVCRDRGISVTHKFFSMQTWSECPIVPVQVVVMRHLIEHIDDLQDLLCAVRHALSVDGLLVIETEDLDVLLNRPLYFDFLNEHLSYFSELTLSTLLSRHGFEIAEVRRVPIQEGSLLFISRKREPAAPWDPKASAVNANLVTPYVDRCRVFAKQQTDYIRAFQQFIQQEIERGITFAGYGAGLRINLILGMLELSSRELLFICDKNPLLHGKFTYGSHILICPPQRLFDDPPGAVIVFAHPHQEEIVDELAAYRDRGGRFVAIYPFPHYLD